MSSTRPLVSLCMIVKDEATSIEGVLNAVKPHIDRWTIVDTGSVDGTPDIVLKTLADKPGTLVFAPFVDFATTRNLVLDFDADKISVGDVTSRGIIAAQGYGSSEPAIFQLMLSGDEYLRDGARLREQLEGERECSTECYLLRVRVVIGDDEREANFQQRVFRTGSDWRYEFEIHEIPFNRKQENALVLGITGAEIEHIVSDVDKRNDNIWEKHVPHFRAKLAEEPKDAHALFYLAQSLEALLQVPGFFSPEERITFAMEAMSMHRRRLQLPIGDLERIVCETRYLDDARTANIFTKKEMFVRAELLFKLAPNRPELAFLYADLAVGQLPGEQLFDLYAKAGDIAASAEESSNDSSPVPMALKWMAHLKAVGVAVQVAAKYPAGSGERDHWKNCITEQIKLGTSRGGKWDHFKPFVDIDLDELAASKAKMMEEMKLAADKAKARERLASEASA